GRRRRNVTMSLSMCGLAPNASGPGALSRRRCLSFALGIVLSAVLAESQEEKQPTSRSASIPIAKLKHASPVDFDREILPILKNNCLACHNKSTVKAGLVLETPPDMLKGGDSGPVI